MALIVEDGTGLAAAESYNSVAEIDTYLGRFGASASWLGAKSVGALSLEVIPGDAETVVLGSITYVWKTTVASAYDVTIGANVATARGNMLKAINASGIAGTDYGTGTLKHLLVEALNVQDTLLNVRALLYGDHGNALATTDTMAYAGNAWGGTVLAGGADPTLDEDEKERHARMAFRFLDSEYRFEGQKANALQGGQHPRTGMEDSSGVAIISTAVYKAVKDAHAIACERSSSAELQPDQITPGFLTEETVRIGPIRETLKYATSGKSNETYHRQIDALLWEITEDNDMIVRG